MRPAFNRLFAPTTAWLAAVIAVVAGALVSGVGSAVLALNSQGVVDDLTVTHPDVAVAVDRLSSATPSEAADVLRHIRNQLDAEAVSLVSPDGVVMRSTAGSLEQTDIGEAAPALASGKPSAGTVTSVTRIDLDGVVEWPPGSELVQVVHPLGDGSGVMLTYDPAEIERRRSEAEAGSPLTVPLALFALVFTLTAVLLEAARRQSMRARHEMSDADASRQDMASELAIAQHELEAEQDRSRLRSRSTVTIIHEQRTLLTGVLTGAELLTNSVHLDLSERDLLENIIADGERLAALTDQMLVAAGADAGLQVKLRSQPLSVVIDKLRRTDQRAHISMTQGLGMGPIDVHTDPTMLSQLVASLVDNSYTHGSRRVEIVVTDTIPGTIHHRIGTPPPSAVFIAVVDDGPGIDHSFLPRAFEVFVSGTGTRGRGMGLYLARMMVEALGTSLSVITSPRGTVMAIAVPARIGEQAA